MRAAGRCRLIVPGPRRRPISKHGGRDGGASSRPLSAAAVGPDRPKVVAFVYRDPSLGTYWVEERSSGWTDATLKSLADCPSVDGGCGDPAWTLTTLADGTTALQIGTPPATVVIFLRNGVRFDVLGPPDEFKESNGVSVANALSSAATSAN